MEISPGAVFKNCGEFTHVVYGWLGNNKCLSENQDGDIGRHLRLLTQPELTENQTARKSETKEIKHKHLSRPVGGAEMDTGVERTCVAVGGRRLVECGTNGAGSLTTSSPCSPTFAYR